MTTENFVEFEEKCRKLSSAKAQCIESYGNHFSDAYQSKSSIYFKFYSQTLPSGKLLLSFQFLGSIFKDKSI